MGDEWVHGNTAKRRVKQDAFLKGFSNYHTVTAACEASGIGERTFHRWLKEDGTFRQLYDEMAKKKQTILTEERIREKGRHGLVYDSDREVPPKGDFATWRKRYMGRTVLPHQRELVEAYEDRSNLVIFCLLPPGAGKDSTAGDFVLYETCDDRNHRAAWVMRGETFSKRRVAEKLDPYLTDHRTYLTAPAGADSVKPEGDLITDYGPFKYKQGMVDQHGVKLDMTTWTKSEIYFLKSGAPEADPNLWATGMEGQLYGSRIDTFVMSDVFDRENQKELGQREGQYEWVMGTLDSRLDSTGRLIILGTRCLSGDNYERLINSYVGEAAVVYQGEHYTKYANGVALIVVPAISHNDEGEEVSYWPEAFPLDSYFKLPDGELIPVKGADQTWLREKYGGRVQRVRGLREIRDKNVPLFDTMYQQKPPDELTGDFTDMTLDAADDDTRTFKVYRTNELIVIGADPARSAGAAWVAWGVDRDKGTITLIDYFFGKNLGIQGLKSKLVVNPIALYNPVWYCYETNREAAVVDDPEIQRVFKDFSVNLHRHNTNWTNRSSNVIGVPSLSFYMRSRVIRWPTMTAADRDRLATVKEQFKTWDRKEALNTHRAALKGQPDDIAMAAWVGFVKAVAMLERRSGGTKTQAMPVPRSVQRKWDRMQERNREKSYIKERERGAAVSMKEVLSLVIGSEHEH